MYENKINPDTLHKAVDQYLVKCVGNFSAFPLNKFYKSMSDSEKNTLNTWLLNLNELGLRANFVSSNKTIVVVESIDDFKEYESMGTDLYFYCFDVNPALSASWLYEMYCVEMGITSEFDADKLNAQFHAAYREVDRVSKTHFLKVALEKNAFVIVGLIFMVLSLLFSNVSAVCFILFVGVIMSFFMHFILARRIFDEEMVGLVLRKLQGIGEDEIIRSVIISNTILMKRVNGIVNLIKA